LQGNNPTIGDGPWTVGTRVNIPAYRAPHYYVLPRPMTKAQIAAVSGISRASLDLFNNGPSWTKYGEKPIPKGVRIRNR
jgi:hypothetical protein